MQTSHSPRRRNELALPRPPNRKRGAFIKQLECWTILCSGQGEPGRRRGNALSAHLSSSGGVPAACLHLRQMTPELRSEIFSAAFSLVVHFQKFQVLDFRKLALRHSSVTPCRVRPADLFSHSCEDSHRQSHFEAASGTSGGPTLLNTGA